MSYDTLQIFNKWIIIIIDNIAQLPRLRKLSLRKESPHLSGKDEFVRDKTYSPEKHSYLTPLTRIVLATIIYLVLEVPVFSMELPWR